MQQVKFGSTAVEGEVTVRQREALALKQDRVFQLIEARHRAALALPRIRIIGCVRQLREAPSQLVILKLRTHLQGHISALFLLIGVEVLWDIEHLRVVA